jgi:ribosomal protein L35
MAKNKTNKVSARRYRDSLNGRFVTKKFAKKHRDTTVKESRTAAVDG